jgi:hypothetical protein
MYGKMYNNKINILLTYLDALKKKVGKKNTDSCIFKKKKDCGQKISLIEWFRSFILKQA